MQQAAMRSIMAGDLGRDGAYRLLNSLVVPRPIAWVSTVSAAGLANVAPHSYTTIASVDPPMLLFVSVGEKDTVRNLGEVPEFVVGIVDEALAERMNVTAASAPPAASEFELAGLDALPSTVVQVPRVADSPASLECTVEQVVPLGSDPAYVIIGEVRAIHVREDLMTDRGIVDQERIRAIARMGANTYARTTDRFDMVRPTYDEVIGAS